MNLEILTPEKKLFSSDVYGVQLPGIGGKFEVLEKHAPIVSALGSGIVKVLIDKTQTQQIIMTGGFAEVFGNKITVLAEGATEA